MAPKQRQLTCIVCPRGCTLDVTLDDAAVVEVKGNACKRGAAYAEAECTHPRRTVTSTVRCADGAVVAVKTADTVPKETVFDVMRAINAVTAPNTVHIGDVILKDVCHTGVDVVATANK